MAQNINYSIAPSDTVEAEICRRLDRLRLAQNISQERLANKAGVSRRTLTRLANGDGITLDTLIRVMQALGLADHLETLLPDPSIRPVERVKLGGAERQRARTKSSKPASKWTWGDTEGQE